MFKKVYSTKINVIANVAGSLWTAMLNILFVPLYLRYVGIEAYGLIGVFTSIQALIGLLDLGLSPTINRELARLSARGGASQEMHNLKRTLEIPNWIVAGLVAALLLLLSPLLANYWIQPKDLSAATVTQALLIISVNIAVQFSSNFYIGALMGMQKQLFFNLINIICGTLRAFGAVFILIYVSPTVQAFLIWQAVIALLQASLFSLTLKYSLPDAPKKGTFQKDMFRKIWRFAAGMTGISAVNLILTQMDKVILSRMLSLEIFGYYSLAVTISGAAISIAVGAIAHSVYPQFSRFVSVGDEESLRDYYHKSCQIVSVVVLPTVVVLAFFSYNVLLIWTKNAEITANTSLILTLLAIGSGLNSLMWLPSNLQLAYGWTKLAFYMNLGSIIVLIPFMIYGIGKYGAVGGAAAWILLNSSYILITIQIMHRRVLKNEQWKWYFYDVGVALLVNLAIAGISRLIFPAEELSRIATFLWLGATWAVCLTVPALIYPATREMLLAVKLTLWAKIAKT